MTQNPAISRETHTTLVNDGNRYVRAAARAWLNS